MCRNPASLVLVSIWVPASFSFAGGGVRDQRKEETACLNSPGFFFVPLQAKISGRKKLTRSVPEITAFANRQEEAKKEEKHAQDEALPKNGRKPRK